VHFNYYCSYFVFEVIDEVMQVSEGLVGRWLHFHGMVSIGFHGVGWRGVICMKGHDGTFDFCYSRGNNVA